MYFSGKNLLELRFYGKLRHCAKAHHLAALFSSVSNEFAIRSMCSFVAVDPVRIPRGNGNDEALTFFMGKVAKLSLANDDEGATSSQFSAQRKLGAEYVGDMLSCEQSLSLTSKLSSDSAGQSTITLSPCIICDSAERSHIAMPCMHFYFCGSCVEDMNKLEKQVCPICSTEDVAFTKVFTG